MHLPRPSVPGGQFTQLVPGLRAGDTLQVALPYGNFQLREGSAAPLLCVAGGTGFAPVKSLLDDLVKRGEHRKVTLVWGGRTREGVYLPAAVERWQKALPGFTFLPALEDAADALALGAFHGRVDAAVRSLHGPLAGHEVYCCGAPAMVTAVRQACVEEGQVAAADFFSDVFVTGPAVPG